MTATPAKPKLTIENDTPITIALRYPSGKVVGSRIPGAPNQVYYSLQDGRSMYLPLQVGLMIDALKLRTGEPFTLVKRGPRDWEVKRTSERTLPHGEPAGPVNGAGEDASTILTRCYAQGIEIALKAVETARQRGLMVTPSFEDLRCISSVLMIAETGRR